MRKLKSGGVTLTKREAEMLITRLGAREFVAQFVAPTATASPFRTRRERKAGKGWPCTVAGSANCGRRDLRTEAAGASHDSTQPHYHFVR